jgi:hypothetical protein
MIIGLCMIVAVPGGTLILGGWPGKGVGVGVVSVVVFGVLSFVVVLSAVVVLVVFIVSVNAIAAVVIDAVNNSSDNNNAVVVVIVDIVM